MATKIKRPRLTERKAAAAKKTKKDIAASYNKFKKFHGKEYTGMTVGRTHNWYYDQGAWKEKKITPDKWEIHFDVVKRRKGHAPEGSGVPIGTQYHWYILADQTATKLNANDYTTSMWGLKFKIAHKRFDKDKWNISEHAQKKLLIKIFHEMIAKLEKELEEPEKEDHEEVKKEKPKTVRKTALKRKKTGAVS